MVPTFLKWHSSSDTGGNPLIMVFHGLSWSMTINAYHCMSLLTRFAQCVLCVWLRTIFGGFAIGNQWFISSHSGERYRKGVKSVLFQPLGNSFCTDLYRSVQNIQEPRCWLLVPEGCKLIASVETCSGLHVSKHVGKNLGWQVAKICKNRIYVESIAAWFRHVTS